MQVGDLYNPKGMFTGVFIPESMVKLPKETLSPGAKLLFGRLCWHVNDAGECFPSRPTLAGEIGVSESSVREYLRELEEAQFIQRVRNGPHANDYEFPWHPCLEKSLKRKDRHRSVDLDGHPSVDQEKKIDTRVTLDGHPSVGAYKDLREDLREEKETLSPKSSLSEQISTSEAVQITEKHLGRNLAKAEKAGVRAEHPYRGSTRETLGEDLIRRGIVARNAKCKPFRARSEDDDYGAAPSRTPHQPWTPPSAPKAQVVEPEPESVQDMIAGYQDEQFAAIMGYWVLAGYELMIDSVADARSEWLKIAEEDRGKCVQSAERKCKQTEARFLPTPAKWLSKKPHKAMFLERILPDATAPPMSKADLKAAADRKQAQEYMRKKHAANHA